MDNQEQRKFILNKYSKDCLTSILYVFLGLKGHYDNAKNGSERWNVRNAAIDYANNRLPDDIYLFLNENSADGLLKPIYFETDIERCVDGMKYLLKSE